MKKNPVPRISIRYMKPEIIKINGIKTVKYIDYKLGYQIPEKALVLLGFQLTKDCGQNINFQLSLIKKFLPEWRKRKFKETYLFLSPRPPAKNKRRKENG